MGLPSKLKNMNLTLNGRSLAGVAGEVDLPKLSRKLEEWRGGGMNGPIEADMGQEKIALAWTTGGLVREALASYGSARHDADQLRFTGAYQRDDTGRVMAVEIVVRGRTSEIDMGKGKPGSDTEHKFTTACSYYKLSIDGRAVIEIDLLNMVEIVNGIDRLAEQRAALGL